MLTTDDVAKHNSQTDCWITVRGNVYDVTEFLEQHPGGSEGTQSQTHQPLVYILTRGIVLLSYAGSDATGAYDSVHMPELIEKSPPDSIKRLGSIDIRKLPIAADLDVQNNSLISKTKPPLDTLINSYDFEAVAEKTSSPKTWAFFSSAATDLISMKLNKEAFNRILFRPRVMRNNKDVDTTTTILGIKTKTPFFIAPTAMAKMIHEDGELAVSKGAGKEGIIHIVSKDFWAIGGIVRELPAITFG